MRAQFRSRIRLVLAGVLVIACIILIRLYFVQIIHGQLYSAKADDQFASGSGGLFDRGSIYFTTKDGVLVSAATLATGFLVAINPQILTNPDEAYQAIAAVSSTTIPYSMFITDSGKKDEVYIEVAHQLSDTEGQTLSAENIPGVEVLQERWRYYPGGSLAAQTIGIVSYGSGTTLTGESGLEESYNSVLTRSDSGLFQNFFAELFSNVGNLVVKAQNVQQGDIITTIEPEVETRLADDLASVTQQYSSKESGGIIMDTSTGAIIALATYPTYDENNLQGVDPSLLTNPIVEHVYEFGSIMKPITMASALTAGVITATSTYDDTGCIHVDGARICNWNYKAYGVIPMETIIEQSLNVGASWIATQLGEARFRSYFTQVFGQKTGIDLPNESDALLTNLSKPQQVYYDTASFGEGIAVTPIQMMRALDAVANGGVMVRPHVVSGIVLDSGITRELDWSGGIRVFSPAAAQETTVMMDALNDDVLYNGKYVIPTMSVAVKTGTAQLPTPTGGYYTNHFFNSFVGFFPSTAPRFIILLYTNDPHAVYADITLVGTFEDLLHFLINYYNIPPDRAPVAMPSSS